MNARNNARLIAMPFARIYPMYIDKVEKKGRTQAELDEVITWLTGYDAARLKAVIANETTVGDFFDNAPAMNPNANLITGAICGYRVEDIDDPLLQKIRYLDKLVDELAKGKAMEKILRAA